MATDVAELEALAGSESTGDLRQAAKLYEGDLLEEVRYPGFEDWLASERARLREVTIGVLGRLTAGLAQSYFCQKGLAVSILASSSFRPMSAIMWGPTFINRRSSWR